MNNKHYPHLLCDYMHLEVIEEQRFVSLNKKQQNAISISHAQIPNGRKLPLLKTLLTSACESNCYYCPFRSGRNYRRATLQPEEMARTFITLHQAGIVKGLFLSSGIAGSGIKTQDRLIACAEILRYKYKFEGYVHLKIMPGAEKDQIARSMQLANRVSINLEGPNSERLKALSPNKVFLEEIIRPIKWTNEIKNMQDKKSGWNGKWPSVVTQFVVGAVGDTDKEILSTTVYLQNNYNLWKAYYSRFNPITDTPFENKSPTPLLRPQRLYQASFLLRDYGFNINELLFDETENLHLNIDPKLYWAKTNLTDNPVEINNASYEELLRVPGFGPKGVKKIIESRLKNILTRIEDLYRIDIHPAQALPFILLNGKRPQYQTSFF